MRERQIPLDIDLLRRLEESLWQTDTRFDPAYMESVLASDFVEFGRSGRIYNRAYVLEIPRAPIDARIPLPNFQVRAISDSLALITYDSEVRRQGNEEHAHRSSIWSLGRGGWRLRFHQATAFRP